MLRLAQRPRLPRELQDVTGGELTDGSAWERVHRTGDLVGTVAERIELVESRLTSVRLTGAQLPAARMRDCVVERCDLSGALLEDARLDRCEFTDCRLSGTIFTAAQLRNVRFLRCRMDTVSFRMAAGTGLRFEECDLTGADFYDAQMSGTQLLKCRLEGANLSRAELAGSELHGSDVVGLLGTQALRGISIDATQVTPIALAVFSALDIAVTDHPTHA